MKRETTHELNLHQTKKRKKKKKKKNGRNNEHVNKRSFKI